jgi:hypothetical protein
MNFSMMAATERHSKLIAGLAAKSRMLCEPEMVGICRASTANETSLLGDGFDMFAVANATCGRHHQHAFIDGAGLASFSASFAQSAFALICDLRGSRGESRNLQLECLLNVLGILCGQRIFDADYSVSPMCGFVGRFEVLQLGGKLVS